MTVSPTARVASAGRIGEEVTVVPGHDWSSAAFDLARCGRCCRSNSCRVPIRVHKPDWWRILAPTPPLADRLLDACPPDLNLVPHGVIEAGYPCCTIARLREARARVVLLILGEKPSTEVAAVKDRTGAWPHGNATGVDLCNVQVLHRVEEVGYHAR